MMSWTVASITSRASVSWWIPPHGLGTPCLSADPSQLLDSCDIRPCGDLVLLTADHTWKLNILHRVMARRDAPGLWNQIVDAPSQLNQPALDS